jgi:hypothetical protein
MKFILLTALKGSRMKRFNDPDLIDILRLYGKLPTYLRSILIVSSNPNLGVFRISYFHVFQLKFGGNSRRSLAYYMFCP